MSKNTRIPVGQAWEIANKVSQVLRGHNIKYEICGSLKRGNKPDAGDIDIAVSDLAKTRDCFDIPNVTAKQATTEVDGMKVGFYQALPDNWGAMSLFLTGSGKFNIAMRIFAKAHGFKLNQYGLWQDEKLVVSTTEEEIFAALGLKYLPPKAREEVRSLWKHKL